MNIILCGMPMSGKSTLGSLLAQQLNKPFIDTDYLIERDMRLSCREITLQYGEKAFRDREVAILQQLAATTETVIATGGGTLTNLTSRQLLQQMGVLIYLQVDLDVLFQRLHVKSPLPSYIDPLCPLESLQNIMEVRSKQYETCAHIQINPSKLSVVESVDLIYAHLKQWRSHG